MGSQRVGHDWVTEQQQHYKIWVLSFLNVRFLSCDTNPLSVQYLSGPSAAPMELGGQGNCISLKLMSVKSVMPSNRLILCCPLLFQPSVFSSIRVFSKESVLHIRWPKYWSFSFSICPSNEHPGLNSFRMDWLDLLIVQGTLKSLLQHHSSKASILWCSAFFTVQFSHPHVTTGKHNRLG